MITTLTLNPAIDRTLILENFEINSLNRVKSVSIDAGGKGINASKVINFFGESTTALGILGGATGKEMIAMLDEKGIKHDFVWASGKTRINTKVVDIANNTCTDINEAGARVCEKVLSELKQKVREYALSSEILIFSGNAQEGIPETIYKDVINGLKDTNAKIILDASGELLKQGLLAAPWLIKPNVAELSEILGLELTGISEIIHECRKLNDRGIEYVCVSMGSEGLLLVTEHEAIIAKPPHVKAKSTVGAGDSVVASLAVSLLRKESLEEALKTACAISAASVMLSGTGVPTKEMFQDIYQKVETKTFII